MFTLRDFNEVMLAGWPRPRVNAAPTHRRAPSKTPAIHTTAHVDPTAVDEIDERLDLRSGYKGP
jgi:hypothetical protein